MAELKTKPTKASVSAHLKAVEPAGLRVDCQTIDVLLQKITKHKPVMWGSAIVGYGSYHYQSERSAQKGDWPLIAFAARKAGLTLYVMPGCQNYKELLKKLGKHKATGSCLLIKKLSDVDLAVLTSILRNSFTDMKNKYQA